MILLWIIIFILTLIGLIKSADYFTEYSEKIGKLLGISSFVIGATIVAIGTSLPELVSSLFALQAGASSFVADNIIGSNIANTLLILGIASVVAKTGLRIQSSLVDTDLPFLFLTTALFSYFAFDATLVFNEGIFLLTFFILYVIYTLFAKKPKEEEGVNDTHHNRKEIFRYLGVIILSVIILAVSAKYFIDAILMLSELLHISSSTLTISVVAFGTSLPEILTSIAAVRRGNHGMAIGNVLGSNIFNLLLIGGLPAIITPLAISSMSLTVGIPFLIITTFIGIVILLDNKVRRWEGVLLIFFYIIFVAKITNLL